MKIIISHLSFGYKQPLFSNLNLEIPLSDITLLLGENGSGKTTFCRLLTGLIKDYEGTIKLVRNGKNQNKPAQHSSLFTQCQPKSMNLQDLSIQEISKFLIYHKQEPQANVVAATPDEDLSIWQSRFKKKLNSQHAEQRNEVLSELEISDLIETPFWELSSGQIKRSGLAAMLLNQEKFWLLDEPFSGLHQEIIIKLKEILLQRKSLGFGTLIISHKTEQLQDIADRRLKIEENSIKDVT